MSTLHLTLQQAEELTAALRHYTEEHAYAGLFDRFEIQEDLVPGKGTRLRVVPISAGTEIFTEPKP